MNNDKELRKLREDIQYIKMALSAIKNHLDDTDNSVVEYAIDMAVEDRPIRTASGKLVYGE